MNKPIITPVTLDDINSVERIAKISFENDDIGGLYTSNIETLVGLCGLKYCLVSKDSSKTITGFTIGDLDGLDSELLYLAVDPNNRNQNIGTYLLLEQLIIFNKAGAKTFSFDSLESSKDFYKKFCDVSAKFYDVVSLIENINSYLIKK